MKIEETTEFINKLFIFLIFILILIPKINLIPIPGITFHQQVRFEEFIIIFYCFFLLLNLKYLKINLNSISIKLLIFLPFFLFSIANGYVNNVKQYWIFIPRFLEYVFLIYIIENFIKNKNDAVKICKFVIIINFSILLLQINNLFGGFTSVGYFPAGSEFIGRPFGLTGGAWEVGALMSLSFLIIYKFGNNNILSLLFYFIITALTLYYCQTRGTIFAFSITLFFMLNSKLLKLFLVVIIFVAAIYLFPKVDFLNKLLKINPFYLYDNLKFFISNGYANQDMYQYSYYYSIAQRFDHISTSFILWKQNISTILFGIGFEKIYIDSFYLRILISFGIVGSLFIIIFSLLNLPFVLLVFLSVSGVTLDHIFSMKIFLLTVLFIHTYKNLTNE